MPIIKLHRMIISTILLPNEPIEEERGKKLVGAIAMVVEHARLIGRPFEFVHMAPPGTELGLGLLNKMQDAELADC